MLYAGIVKAVERLKKRYNEDDPFELCALMGIKVLLVSMGTSEGCVKGFFLESNRIRTITVNADMPLVFQRIIVTHELGHAVLHRHAGVFAFHDFGLFDDSSRYEKDANLFAAELLLKDEEVLQTLNADTTFFAAASALNVPMELLDFKFRVMKWKGYKVVEPPIIAKSNFLKDLEVPNYDEYGA